MPTYEQLNQEAAWRNEYMPEPMKWFCREVAAALGVPQINVGAKGDNSPGHMRGGHRSQRWILTSRYCTNRTYTVYPGLPERLLDALGAIDITPKSREQMLSISRRIDVAARAGLIEEVVAWYGNTNNDQHVDGWDNIRNAIASSDSSHLWHLHLTLNRWALASWEFFQRLLAVLLGGPVSPQEEDMTPLQATQLQNCERYLQSLVQMKDPASGISDTVNLHEVPNELVQELKEIKALLTAGGGDPASAAILARLDEIEAAVASLREAHRKASQAGAIEFDTNPVNDLPV